METFSFPKGHVCPTNCPQNFLLFQGIAANKADVCIASVKIRDNFNPLFLPSPSVCLSITSLAFFPHLTPSAAVTHSLLQTSALTHKRTNAFDNNSPSVAGYSGFATHHETQEHLPPPNWARAAALEATSSAALAGRRGGGMSPRRCCTVEIPGSASTCLQARCCGA